MVPPPLAPARWRGRGAPALCERAGADGAAGARLVRSVELRAGEELKPEQLVMEIAVFSTTLEAFQSRPTAYRQR